MSTQLTNAWTRFIGSSNEDAGYSISTTPDGAIYIAGVANRIKGEGISTWSGDAFVSKYNSNGINEWINYLDSSSYDSATSIYASTDGSIYISGYTAGAFEGQTNSGDADAFISKRNSDGTNAWIRLLGSPGFDRATSIASATDGAIYIAGSADGSFDGETINQNPSPGRTTDAFISKYSSDGTKEWTRFLGSIERDSASSISATSNGEVYITGFTYGSFDGQIKQTQGGDQDFDHADVFVSKYLSNGTKIWTRLLGSTLGEFANSIATTNDGDIYIAGYTYGSFDGQTNSGNGDAYISKYNSDGTNEWTRIFGSANFDSANSISISPDGYIYITGSTFGSFDGQTYSGGVEEGNAFISKYDTNGVKAWTEFLPSSNFYSAYDINSSPNGVAYIAGVANGSFDGQTHGGEGDAFISKFVSVGNGGGSGSGGGSNPGGSGGSGGDSGSVNLPATTSATPVTPTLSQGSPVLGIQPQEAVATVQLMTPLTLGNLQVTQAVVGTPQNDVITGSNVGEALAGGIGKDQMTGGGGPDAFLFETPGEFGKKSLEIVTDFNPGEGDKVVISKDAFGGVTKVKLDVASGKKDAKSSASSKKTFIYDERTGVLYFNENGKKDGFGDGGEFAKLLGAPEIGKGDFVIV